MGWEIKSSKSTISTDYGEKKPGEKIKLEAASITCSNKNHPWLSSVFLSTSDDDINGFSFRHQFGRGFDPFVFKFSFVFRITEGCDAAEGLQQFKETLTNHGYNFKDHVHRQTNCLRLYVPQDASSEALLTLLNDELALSEACIDAFRTQLIRPNRAAVYENIVSCYERDTGSLAVVPAKNEVNNNAFNTLKQKDCEKGKAKDENNQDDTASAGTSGSLDTIAALLSQAEYDDHQGISTEFFQELIHRDQIENAFVLARKFIPIDPLEVAESLTIHSTVLAKTTERQALIAEGLQWCDYADDCKKDASFVRGMLMKKLVCDDSVKVSSLREVTADANGLAQLAEVILNYRAELDIAKESNVKLQRQNQQLRDQASARALAQNKAPKPALEAPSCTNQKSTLEP